MRFMLLHPEIAAMWPRLYRRGWIFCKLLRRSRSFAEAPQWRRAGEPTENAVDSELKPSLKGA